MKDDEQMPDPTAMVTDVDVDAGVTSDDVAMSADVADDVAAAESRAAASGPDVVADTERAVDLTESSETTEGVSADGETIGLAEARRAVEAILMVADQPIAAATLGQLLAMDPVAVQELCAEMAADFDALGHGFQLVHVAGGWRFQSHPAMAQYVERFALDGQVSRLSAAALETLAIVAYKQPISRAQIAQIRGVNVDGVMRTLTQRGYVAEVATDPGPGQASLFGTTVKFLESMGMGSIANLAPLADFVPGSEIMEALEAGLRVDTVVDTTLVDTTLDAPVPEPVTSAETDIEPASEPATEPAAEPDADVAAPVE